MQRVHESLCMYCLVARTREFVDTDTTPMALLHLVLGELKGCKAPSS